MAPRKLKMPRVLVRPLYGRYVMLRKLAATLVVIGFMFHFLPVAASSMEAVAPLPHRSTRPLLQADTTSTAEPTSTDGPTDVPTETPTPTTTATPTGAPAPTPTSAETPAPMVESVPSPAPAPSGGALDVVYVDAQGACGGNAPCYTTIQAGVDAVAPGGTVNVAAGTYTETVSINCKVLTLAGAGAGVTTVRPSQAGQAAIRIQGGGTAEARLVVRDLTVTGVTRDASGWSPGALTLFYGSHVTFERVTATGNEGGGILLGLGPSAAANEDIEIIDCEVTDNAAGVGVGSHPFTVNGLTITGGTISRNARFGLWVPGDTGTTSVTVSGTTFLGNGVGCTEPADSAIRLVGFNGNATFSGLTVDATGAQYGVVIEGKWFNPPAPLGAVALSNVRITGSPQRAGLTMRNYSDASRTTFSDVTIDVDLETGTDWMYAGHAALQLAQVGGSLNLGTLKLAGIRGAGDGTTPPAVDIWADKTTVDATHVVFQDADSNFAIEQRVFHALDGYGEGLVTWVPNNLYVPAGGSIQRAAQAASSGYTVNVAPGFYVENVVIEKRLTLQGQGSGEGPWNNTIIAPARPNDCVIGVKAGGSSASDRLVIKNLRLANASGNGSPAIWLTEHASHLTIDNVAMVGNAGPGLVMGATGTITDVVVNNCLFANNLSGLSVGPGGAVVGLSITNSRFEGNACYGLNVAGHGGTTDLTVADTTFAGNGAAGVMAQSSANISLWGYNGSATLRNVTIDASQALYGIVINGEWQDPARPMGAVSFSNVRVTGSPVLQSGVSIGHYSDARGLGIDGLDVNADVMPGLDPWGNRHAALLMVDLSSPSPIVLKNTSFAGSRGPVELGGEPAYDLVASLADVDASGVTFSSADDFAIEDLVHHRLDQEWLGLVMRSAGNVWVTPRSGSLQRGVNAVAAGGTVHVAPGAYYEPMMTIKKPVRLCSAAGSDDTIIYNTSGSPSVIVVASSSVTIEGFTVRGGTGVAGVHRPALYARSEDGSQLSGITVRNCRFAPWDMQAIALHNVANCSLENNTFEVHLSPGSESPGAMLEIAGVAGLTATGNRFSGETDGVEVLGEGDGLGESTGIRLFNNSFSDLAGQPIHNGATSLVDASGNWWGTNSAAAMTATVGANVDYTPWLDSGTDLSSAIGFQGDFSALWADASSPQAGDKHPVQEAIDLVTSPGVVRLAPGTYAGGIVVDKPGVTLIGSDGTVIAYGSPAVTIAANNVTVSRIHAEGAGAGAGTAGIVVTSGVANPVIQNCEVAHWPGDGIVFEGGVISPTLSANVIEENAGNAILFQGEVVGPTLTGNTIADNTGDAILFAADVSDPTVTDNTVTGNTGGGITFTQPPAGEVTISGNAGWLPITTSATPNPAPVGTVITLSATVGDGAAGSPRIISAEYSLDGTDTWLAMVPRDGGFDSSREEVTASLGSYSSPGVIQVWVRGADAAGNTSVPQCVLVAVYDPAAGFVTGGGWIVSPPGAYTPDNPGDLDVTGRASFAFVSRYKKGATVPTGQTEFQFQAGNLNFHSEVYDWLVVAGSKAQYKGTGTINGTGQYGFMLTAVDGDLKGREPDKFRIKIWEKATGTIVYDNQAGAGDTADPTTTLGGGNIVIHP